MSGASVSIPIALDFGNLLIIVLGGLLAFVWRTLTEKIENGDRATEQASRERNRRLEEKLNTLEGAYVSLPQRMDNFSEQLKRIELLLANQYVTKEDMLAEVSRSVETHHERSMPHPRRKG